MNESLTNNSIKRDACDWPFYNHEETRPMLLIPVPVVEMSHLCYSVCIEDLSKNLFCGSNNNLGCYQ